MDKIQENKLSSYKSTENLLDNTVDIYKDNTGFIRYKKMYTTELSQLINLSVVQKQDITGTAQDKDSLENEIIQEVVEIGGALFAFSFEKNDNALSELVNVSPSVLKGCRDNDLYAKCKGIFDKAVKHAVEISELGIPQPKIDNLKKNLESYKTVLSTPRDMIIIRKDATKRIADQIEKIDAILKGTLDKLINIYRYTNPDFYNQYRSSRIIVDLGIRHKKEVE